MSIPLGRVWSNYHLTTDQHGRTNQQLGVSGTALEDHNLNYSVQEGYGSNGVGNSGSVNPITVAAWVAPARVTTTTVTASR